MPDRIQADLIGQIAAGNLGEPVAELYRRYAGRLYRLAGTRWATPDWPENHRATGGPGPDDPGGADPVQVAAGWICPWGR